MIKFGESFSLGSLLNQSQTYQGNPCGVYPYLSSFTGSGVFQNSVAYIKRSTPSQVHIKEIGFKRWGGLLKRRGSLENGGGGLRWFKSEGVRWLVLYIFIKKSETVRLIKSSSNQIILLLPLFPLTWILV